MSSPPNGSLGAFTVAPASNSTPAQYQPVALQNNQTLYDSYQVDHVALGAANNSGYHNKVTLTPQTAAPTAIDNIWQIYPQGSNVYLVPPNGTGVTQQLNSSALPTSGTYWTQSETVAGAPPITMYYSCPLGGNAIVVTVQLTYATSVLTQATVFVPYKDASGNNLTIPTPMSSFGIGILQSNGGGGAYAVAIGWGAYTAAGNVGAGIGAYNNGIVLTVGKSFTTAAPVVVSGTVTGVFS